MKKRPSDGYIIVIILAITLIILIISAIANGGDLPNSTDSCYTEYSKGGQPHERCSEDSDWLDKKAEKEREEYEKSMQESKAEYERDKHSEW